MDTVLKDNLKHPYVIISGWNYLIISNVCSSVKTMNIFLTYLLMTPRNIKRGNSISFIQTRSLIHPAHYLWLQVGVYRNHFFKFRPEPDPAGTGKSPGRN